MRVLVVLGLTSASWADYKPIQKLQKKTNVGGRRMAGNPEDVVQFGWGTDSQFAAHGTPEYYDSLRKDYHFSPQDPWLYQIDLLVEPCKDKIKAGGRGMVCCYDTNKAGCQHHPVIMAGPDMQVAYFQNAHVSQCVGDFEYDINCGTYIEVHRAIDRKDLESGFPDMRVLSDVKVLNEFPSGYQSMHMATTNLCTGEHQLWWVVRTRSGPYVEQIINFTVLGPSCLPSGETPRDLEL